VIEIKLRKEVSVKILLTAIPIVIMTALSALVLVRGKTKLEEVRIRR